MSTSLNRIRDFENQMAKVSEMMNRITPNAAEAARALARSLGTSLNTEQMLVSRVAALTTMSQEEALDPTRHIINLAQEHAKESTMTTMDAIENLTSVAMSRGVDFITQRKSYLEVIADNSALKINESISFRGDKD